MHRDLLLVDDDLDLSESTTEYLEAFGVTTAHAASGEAAMAWLAEHTASVLILDVNLPGMSGFALCREVRRSRTLPTLFLSARDSDDDQILALSSGADDFLCKPYPMSVLLAKVQRALARAAATAPAAVPVLVDDGWLRFAAESGRVHVDGKEVRLTALEYRLLHCLVAHRGQVVTKRVLFEEVWEEPSTSDSTLSVHIRRLRRQIERDADRPDYIRTVWGRGYLFECRGRPVP